MGNEVIGHHFKEINDNLKNLLGKNFNLFNIEVYECVDGVEKKLELEELYRKVKFNHEHEEYRENSALCVELASELRQNKLVCQGHIREAVLIKKNLEMGLDMVFDKLNIKKEKVIETEVNVLGEPKPQEPPKIEEPEELEEAEEDFIAGDEVEE